ncbi:MAG: M48 family metalloprotease [Arhodomonas sp.]|nr:M48 family metalloprotease [Arhodomonas sp.]
MCASTKGWEVEVFDDDSANAFALPGGKIGVHGGMLELAETPDQLAAVIGHEIAHVMADHSNERMSQQFAVGTGLAGGRGRHCRQQR